MSHIALFILCHCYLGYPCLDLHRSLRPLFCIKLLGHPVSVGERMCLVHCTVPAVDKDGADLLFSTPPSNHSNHSSSRKGSHSMEDADQLQCTFSTHTHSHSHSHTLTLTLTYTLSHSHTHSHHLQENITPPHQCQMDYHRRSFFLNHPVCRHPFPSDTVILLSPFRVEEKVSPSYGLKGHLVSCLKRTEFFSRKNSAYYMRF